jgi:hypothetical protein
MPLPDVTLPDGTQLQNGGNSLVAALWFDAPGHGLIGLAGANATAGKGGAVLGVISPNDVGTTPLLAGGGAFPMNIPANFYGFTANAFGIVARTDQENLFVKSLDGGMSFIVDLAGDGSLPTEAGAQVYMDEADDSSWLFVDGAGRFWQSPKSPDGLTKWAETWAPGATPPVPSPLPAGACQAATLLVDPIPSPQIYRSPDGSRIVYPGDLASTGGVVGVCLSTDGGKTFAPVAFPGVPASAQRAPTVLEFADATHGVALFADDAGSVAGQAYAYLTADGGQTWTAGALPPVVTSGGAAIRGAFGAAGSGETWAVGWLSGAETLPLLLQSTDGGATWTDRSATLAANPASHHRLYVGFALGAGDVWVGGDSGALLHTAKGGV